MRAKVYQRYQKSPFKRLLNTMISGLRKSPLKRLLNKIIAGLPYGTYMHFINFYYAVAKDRSVKIKKHPEGWEITQSGVTLLASTPKLVNRRITLEGYAEKFERFFNIEPCDTVLDVGACIGDTAVPMAMKTGSSGTVIAVEPEPKNIRYLKRNLARFKHVYVIEKAAWNRQENLRFYISPSIMGHSIIDKTEHYTEVPTDTLDNIAKPFSRIDYAKIDVQGAELEVLEAASEMLAKTRKLVVETHYFGERALFPKVAMILIKQGFNVEVTPDRVVHAWKQLRC